MADVVVVGAGSTGAAAAAMLARAGLEVVAIDARPEGEAGARWSDDLPPWLFDRAGVARPEPPERRNRDVPYRLSGRGTPLVELGPSPMWGVDVRRLTARLRADAVAAGAVFRDRTTLVDATCDASGRPVSVRVEAAGRRGTRGEDLLARLFVDASGAAQALLRRVPALARRCPPVRPDEACTGAQAVCDVADRAGAAAFLERIGCRPGDFRVWIGVGAGFSTRIVHLEESLDEVAVLTGAAWDGRTDEAGAMMAALRQEAPWIGPARFGGGGLIPLRRPYDRLAAPGIVLLGDAGCQVFPPTGCGIGSGLVAARMLADAVAGRADPGDAAATWAYAAAFQRERGGVHAGYDVFRRMIWGLSGEDVSDLVRCGLVTAGTTRASLMQEMPRPSPADLGSIAAGAVRLPRLAALMATAVPRMLAVREAYRLYPATPDDRRLAAWSRPVAALAGWTADG